MLCRPRAKALDARNGDGADHDQADAELARCGSLSLSMIAAMIAVVSGSTPWVKALACATGAKIRPAPTERL